MASTSETGHAKNIANLNKLNTFAVGLGALYNPSNPVIYLLNLQLVYTTAAADQKKVNINIAPYSNAVDARELVFMPLNKQLTKLRKIFISTEGVGPLQIEDFMTIIRKLKGARKSPKSKPLTEEEIVAQHSTSQLSYDQRTNSMDLLISFLENTPNYHPNEAEFTIDTYQNKMQEMLDSTDLVNQKYTILNSARAVRNNTLYISEDCLVDIAIKAKAYLLGILPTNSVVYKAILKLQFKKIK